MNQYNLNTVDKKRGSMLTENKARFSFTRYLRSSKQIRLLFKRQLSKELLLCANNLLKATDRFISPLFRVKYSQEGYENWRTLIHARHVAEEYFS